MRGTCAERAEFGSAGLAGLAVTPVEREEITRRGWRRRARWWGSGGQAKRGGAERAA